MVIFGIAFGIVIPRSTLTKEIRKLGPFWARGIKHQTRSLKIFKVYAKSDVWKSTHEKVSRW